MGVPQSAITSIARDIAALLTLIAELAYTSMGQPRVPGSWPLMSPLASRVRRAQSARRRPERR
jgi:hypothetical protein